jgi:lipopolysaccharide/colanic/teichoic acid biosynthesis glycosyltransferase
MKITSQLNLRNLVVLRDVKQPQNELLKLLVCSEPFTQFMFSCLCGTSCFNKNNCKIAVPQQWSLPGVSDASAVLRYDRVIPCSSDGLSRNNSWFVISDGNYITEMDYEHICRILTGSSADVIAVNADSQLQVSHEKVMTDLNEEIVGFRLFYEDALRPMPVPDDWPHHLFVRAEALDIFLKGDGLPSDFSELMELSASMSLTVESVNIGSPVLDLKKEEDLLKLMFNRLDYFKGSYHYDRAGLHDGVNSSDAVLADGARLFGKILMGKGVKIDESAVVVGPAIIGDKVRIGRDAAVRASVVCSGVSVPAGGVVEQKVLTNNPAASHESAEKMNYADSVHNWAFDRQNNFRYWPRFSYVRFLKRILDIAVSIIILILFAPIVPLIVLAIKLTSPGPVLFKDTRQGMHGRSFKCLKFRTMRADAPGMQERLRALNQVDGPQFMMEDDPRISTVGRFLRETYIDEIPQFLNVLMGQMSVVGPRPSPENENRLCPFWRDARLSVRPGITGLWQLYRTRQPMKDFQEWIYYDIKYVMELSLKMDLLVCWKTARKMADKFFRQF